jgi:hypothetical protein
MPAKPARVSKAIVGSGDEVVWKGLAIERQLGRGAFSVKRSASSGLIAAGQSVLDFIPHDRVLAHQSGIEVIQRLFDDDTLIRPKDLTCRPRSLR